MFLSPASEPTARKPAAPLRPEGSSENPIGRTRAEGLFLHSLFLISLCEAVLFGIDTSHFVETLCQHIVRDFSVNLGGLDIGMPQHAADDFDADTLRQRVGCGERVGTLCCTLL